MYAGGSAREKAASLRVEAASLREQAELKVHEAQQWETGAEGEHRVAAELARLEPQGWAVLHDRLVRPGESKANLDHLVVGPAGIVLIDSKNWSSGAWEYNGTLYRNGPSGPAPCRFELAHVKQDADTVRERVDQLVTPVLCLSGPRSGKVQTPIHIDGVHVVPVGQLFQFLRKLPATTPVDVATLAGRLDAALPSACVAPPPAPSTPSWTPPAPARRVRQQQQQVGRRRRPTRTNRGALRPLLIIGGVLMLLALAPTVLSALGKQVGHALTTSIRTPAVAEPFPSPCAAVTDAEVATAVGRPVYRFTTSATDTCRWAYAPPPAADYPADVEITTGWLVKVEADAAHGTVERKHLAQSEGILVPQLIAVPGSGMPASATTQPLAVDVNLTKGISRKTAARAVLALAQLTERHMPTGPGATQVSPVR